MLRFTWFWVIVFDQQIVYVVFHRESACALAVVPCYVDSCKFQSRPICGDFVMLLECMQEVLCMSFVHVFDAEVVHNEDECNGPPFVSP